MSGDGGKKILFSCTGCKSSYSLARAEVDRLPGSVAVCTTCGKNIKIAFCPACGISYSITYSVPMRSRYTLTCRRCAEPFAIEFPSIREPVRIQALPPVPAHGETSTAERPAVAKTRDDVIIEERGGKPRKKKEDDIILALPDRSFLQGALSFLAGVLNIRRLVFAAVAVSSLFALLSVTDRAEAALQGIALVKGSAFLLHLLNFFSIFVICCIFTLSNSITARFCMGETDPSIDTGMPAMFAFAALTQRYMVRPNRWYESFALAISCFVLLLPGDHWRDQEGQVFRSMPRCLRAWLERPELPTSAHAEP